MPALGFDPAPGDVGSTSALARRYAEVAAEVSAVQDQVARVDLTRWQGKAATAARARQAVLVQALSQAADTATKLSGASARWSPHLATYQAEADALERQATAEQANHHYLTSRAPQVPQLTKDLAESATALAGIRAQAEQLHQEYPAAAASILTQFDLKAWWEGTDDIRKYPEAILAFFDTVTADRWITWAKEIGGVPGEVLARAYEKLLEAETLNASGASLEERFAALNEAADAYERAGTGLDAIATWASPFQTAIQAMAGPIGAAKVGFGALGILGDANDILSPQDGGTMGWVDRGAATVNAGFLTADLVGADLVMDAIPGVGEIAIAATGIYLAGDYLYHHWTPFHDVANDIGHATVLTADSIGHATVHAADDLGHDAGAAWHSITSVGSWF